MESFAQAPSYVVQDLGTLGGTASRGYGINNSGQVVGSLTTSGGADHAFLYSSGVMTDLGTLGGGTISYAYRINESGQIAGYSATSGTTGYRAFLYANGTMTNLGTLGGTFSVGYGINNAGQVVGESYLSGDAVDHAYLYSGGSMNDLGALGAGGVAFGINNTGQIAGYSFVGGNVHAILYSGGVATDLGTFGGTNSAAFEINDAGQVAGYAYNSAGKNVAFLYSGGSKINLGTLGGNTSSAIGINAAGQVTGSADTGTGVSHAFLYTGGTMYDVNNLVSATQGVTGISMGGDGDTLNDRGQIATRGLVGGQTHAVLLTPRNMGTAFSGGLGDLPGGTISSGVNGISNGGTVAVGAATSVTNAAAFIWTLSGGMVDFNNATASITANARAVSPDGRYVVGNGNNGGLNGAFRYDNQTASYQQLGFLASYTSMSVAFGVSADGGVVGGYSQNSSGGRQATKWTSAGGMVGLGFLAGSDSQDSVSMAVSGDGTAIVGRSHSANATGSNLEAFRWTQAGGMQALGDLPGGIYNSVARGVSSDGSVVVGGSASSAGIEAFRWTLAGGMVSLGDIAGGAVSSQANGVSGNGQVVVGNGTDAAGDKAFVWDAKHGLRNLQSVLSTEYGVDFAGWNLGDARAISANADAVAGVGNDPLGNPVAWSAQINSRTYRFVIGETYAGFHTSKLGGLGTTVDLLGGTATGPAGTFKTVTVDLLAMPTVQFPLGFASDVIDLSGSGSDTVVLRLGYDEATAIALYGSESKVTLGWFDTVTQQWKTAVTGDDGGTPTFAGDRAYNAATDSALGTYGIDTANNQVWAVINHNSQFAVVPEPASMGLLAIGAGVMGWRRRRRARS